MVGGVYNWNLIFLLKTETFRYIYRTENIFFFSIFSPFLLVISSLLQIKKLNIWHLIANLVIGSLSLRKKYSIFLYHRTKSFDHFGFQFRYKAKTKFFLGVFFGGSENDNFCLFPILYSGGQDGQLFTQL